MAWRTLLALGVVSAVAVGCTAEVKVNGGTNDGGPDSATGGTSGSGGSSTGGSKAGSGGSSGTGGSKTTGGSTGTGGSSGGTDSGGPTTCDTTVSDSCQKCVNTNC